MQGCRLATSQVSLFLTVKLSHLDSGILQECRFADANESRFLFANRCIMGCAVQHCSICLYSGIEHSCCESIRNGNAVPPVFDLMMLRNHLFRLRNVQMWAVPS